MRTVLLEAIPHSDAAWHCALDEALVRDPDSAGIAYIWDLARPALVLGASQSVANEIDVEAAARRGVDIVRRCSGGGTMFLEPGKSIVITQIAPLATVAGLSFRDSFAHLNAWLLDALLALGVPAHFADVNDIATDSGKLAGAAQKRVRSLVLQHTALAYDIDAAAMNALIRIGQPAVQPRGVRSAAKQPDPLRNYTALSHRDTIDYLTRQLPAPLTRMPLAHTVDTTKYRDPAWTFRLA
ncbi:MAG: hypothetical protein LBR20_08575 [Propionibacteriaceae bacterium]|jgi:lipoate-protein ligase A|nr:hypothetical protein [Propionibacteriaceae bacterium]